MPRVVKLLLHGGPFFGFVANGDVEAGHSAVFVQQGALAQPAYLRPVLSVRDHLIAPAVLPGMTVAEPFRQGIPDAGQIVLFHVEQLRSGFVHPDAPLVRVKEIHGVRLL